MSLFFLKIFSLFIQLPTPHFSDYYNFIVIISMCLDKCPGLSWSLFYSNSPVTIGCRERTKKHTWHNVNNYESEWRIFSSFLYIWNCCKIKVKGKNKGEIMHFRKKLPYGDIHKHRIYEVFIFLPSSKIYQKQVQDVVSILKEFSI